MKKVKDYSWSMTVKTAEGEIQHINEANPQRGWRRSWYETEKAARKALSQCKMLNEQFGAEILSWMIFNRNHGIGIIETYIAN